MEELIKKFPAQLTDELNLVFGERRRPAESVVVCGLGGSALAADFLRAAGVPWLAAVHRDYGLPSPVGSGHRLLILSSYSGNTEEVLDAARLAAADQSLRVAAISSGGQLLALAQSEGWPHVVLPEGWPPRLALGWFLRSLALLAGDEELTATLASVKLDAAGAARGADLAEALAGRIPVIYASTVNRPIAYHWKTELNETSKLPAFYNVLPEANHNELSGFDVNSAQADFARRLHFIFLRDEGDHPRLRRRFEVLGQLFRQRHFALSEIELGPPPRWRQLLQNFLVAVWTAYYLARRANVEPQTVPLIEEFKKLIG